MTTKPLWNKADIVTPFDTMKKFEGVTLSRIEGGQDKSFIEKKKHLAVRRLNYVYNIQVIVKMDLKNYNNKNVQI